MAEEPSQIPDGRTPIQRMLEARSVAIVGASIKPGSLGESMLAELRRGGFDGAIYPVNPGYDEVAGLRCYPSILEVPEPVDLAILGVANARVEQALADAAAAGAGSAVTFSSLYEEPGDGPDLRERLRDDRRRARHGVVRRQRHGLHEPGVPRAGDRVPDARAPA